MPRAPPLGHLKHEMLDTTGGPAHQHRLATKRHRSMVVWLQRVRCVMAELDRILPSSEQQHGGGSGVHLINVVGLARSVLGRHGHIVDMGFAATANMPFGNWTVAQTSSPAENPATSLSTLSTTPEPPAPGMIGKLPSCRYGRRKWASPTTQ